MEDHPEGRIIQETRDEGLKLDLDHHPEGRDLDWTSRGKPDGGVRGDVQEGVFEVMSNLYPKEPYGP